jgi:hypothetical protein
VLTKNADSATRFINEIKGMPSYRGDSALRDAAVNIFSFYKRIFLNQYKRIVEIRRKGSFMTKDDLDELKQIIDDISKEEEKLDKNFHNAQQDFADKNNMQLGENSLQKKIDKLHK